MNEPIVASQPRPADQDNRLEALGRLAAGVAHEINTPIQFVGDNIHFIGEGLTDLFNLVEALSALAIEQNRGAETEEKVQKLKEAFDYEFLSQNFPKAIERSADGISRVAEIVQSLKDFSHPDQATMRSVDLNMSIETTLAIAKNEYKYVAEVITEFGQLSMVDCQGGEINQVLLNLIVNSAHAIEERFKGTGQMGRIMIRSRQEVGTVVIEISDNGNGIPEAARANIFDPFFTTKAVGKGTGQGLAIARQVVCQKHGGDLTFETVVGQGTTFTVKLPIQQTHTEARSAA